MSGSGWFDFRVGATRRVALAMKAIEQVTEVHEVMGPYDIIAIAEASDLPSIGNLISDGMHSVPGIVKTVSCLSVGV